MDPYALYSYPYPLPDPESFWTQTHYQQPQVHAPQALHAQSPLLYDPFPDETHHPSLYHPCDVAHVLDDFQAPIQVPTVQSTFPTPSELMAELQVAPPATAMINASGNGLTPPPGQYAIATSGHCADPHTEAAAAETARKARRRAMAESVGFVPTDPDTISSHEKKRHYLECIEQYILYLHEQFDLVGQAPPAMERVATYRGLSSRSIRTLLVHMEHNTRTLNGRTVDEEQRFLRLRNEIEARYK